ncbi:sodium:proton antiporter [Nitrogeniibacter mangrovi]|uniref:Sodium:proton antiporter n=1 Tax=Nitrogeniibacter mangrovi TaxID=2016596 RepID=A0A6C1B414_9RHOO|nr:sodium:proton antiporter [Nitrogeniibacter mangrovi]QID18287.1 sodium:proton antiporter [Nitrogeniibacter mangrovi]
MTQQTIALLAGIAVLGGACQWLAWRMRLPAILFLLLSGIVVGPVAGILDPDALLGDLLFPFVSLAVSVILFEGSLTLKFSEIAGLEKVVRRFVTTGMLITWLITTLATRWLTDFSWGLATLFGAIMVVTGPTVIQPMLRTVRPTAKVASILRWEGIIIDPIGALLAVLVYEFLVSTSAGGAWVETFMTFFRLIGSGLLVGIGVGYFLGEALRRDWLPHYLFNVATLAAVMGAFALSNAVAHESGLLAVTAMGIYLANRKGVPVEEILAFKESLSLLLITALFILLAARLDLGLLEHIGWVAVQIFLVMQFVARPVKVFFATRGSSLNWRERALLGWIAPRGIVAAAVVALFSIQLDQQGFKDAILLVPLTFVVIIGTVVLQSLTAGPLARMLKVAEPGSGGFLIVGANPLARAIAQALAQQEVSVRLTDTLWDNVSRARMAGLKTYYGNPLSEHAEIYLDTSGLGRVLALTADEHLNELACTRFRAYFGPKRTFALRVSHTEKGRKSVSAGGGQWTFGERATFVDLSRRVARGAEIRQTNLSEAFGFEQFGEKYGERATPLFAIDPKGRVEVFTDDNTFAPKAGWVVLALIDPDPAEVPKRAAKTGPARTADIKPDLPGAPPASGAARQDA